MYCIKCKLGYGYIPELKRIIKFDGNPSDVKSYSYNQRDVDSIFKLTSSEIQKFDLGLLLEPSVLKILDFLIVTDEDEYYSFNLYFWNKYETSTSIKYPENVAQWISHLYYGIYMNVIIPKKLFSSDETEVKNLLKSSLDDISRLSEKQKNVKCKVLINTEKIEEKTIEEVINFFHEFKNGKHTEFQTITGIGLTDVKKLQITVENKDEFCLFLTYLYICYRKIELKLEKVGYKLLIISDIINPTIKNIVYNLEKAKNDYKNMDKDDYIQMYPIMKNLFHKYCDYLKFTIDNHLIIDEGNDLPGNINEIKKWLLKLNKWLPVEINNHWYNVDNEQILIIPSDYENIKKHLKSSEKYKNLPVMIDNKLNEPVLYLKNHLSGYFGFIKMDKSNENIDDIEGDKVDLKICCPLKCTKDLRKWLCINCGEIVKIISAYLTCQCTTTYFDKSLLICNNRNHQKTSSSSSLMLLDSNNEDDLMDEALQAILNQLKKHEKKCQNVEIQNVLKDTISTLMENDTDSIITVLSDIQELNIFDGDTKNLIDKYLEEQC